MARFAMARIAMARVSVAWIALACVALTGCRFKGDADPFPSTTPNAGALEQGWTPQPLSVRVYPTTRFLREAGATLLDARVELRDEMNDPVKASGSYRFELFIVAGPGGLATGRAVYIWDRSIRSIEDQRLHYDGITSTYGFRLGVSDPRSAQQSTKLVVTFTPLKGPRLVAEAMLGSELLIERGQAPTQ